MKTLSIISARHLYISILACALTLIVSSTISAQRITDGSTPLGVAPGAPTGSYALSDFDSINLYNGSLNFRLPLVKIAGRGGAGFTMVMRIEKKWLVDKEPGLGQPNRYTPNPNWWGMDGQEPIYSVGKLEMRQGGSRDFFISNSCGFIHSQTLTRLTFTAPDGTEYELRDQSTNGRPDHPTCSSGAFNRGRVFVTADGSSATFVSDADISDYIYDNPANIPPSGHLMLRDGTRYLISGGHVMSMRDRNGNQVTFGYDGAAQLTSITDSLNRKVTITYSDQNSPYDQITVKGFGGAPRYIKVYKGTSMRSDCSVQTYQQLFPNLNGAGNGPSIPAGVTSVQLPNGQQYQFYYNSYSELARVVLPTGAAIEYDYAPGLTDGAVGGVITYAGDKHVYRRVVARRVYPDGGTGPGFESLMTYSRPESSSSNAGYVAADQYNSGGTWLGHSIHYFYGSARASFGQQPTEYPGWKDGREYQTTIYAADGVTPLRQVTSTFAQRAPVSWWTGSADQEPPNDPRLIEKVSTLMDTNQVSRQTSISPYDSNDKGFDQFNNRTDVWEFDYGVGAPGALLRHTHTSFVSTTNYTDAINGAGLLSLPTQTSVFDGNGIERGRTSLEYDNYNSDTNHAWLLNRSGMSGFDSSFSSSYTTRGNLTATTHYLLDTNGSPLGSVSTYAQYDIAGNSVKTIDGRGYSTTLDYSDRFGAPNGEAQSNASPPELSSQGQSSYAFVTLVTNALGQTEYSQFDYYMGQTVDGEDENGIVSSTYYNDDLDRPKQVIRATNGGADVKRQTTINYDDLNHVVTTTSDQSNYGDNLLKSEIVNDNLGRTTEKRQYETASSYIAVRQTYDVLGRSSQTSNPFRAGETILWTTTAYDDLSRVISVTTPDNAVMKTAYGGNRILVADQNQTDQLRRKRISQTDALGRLKDAWEVTSADGATEPVTFPGWPDVAAGYHTSYEYDTLDDLTTVHQGAQTRTFAYDSLKRLTSAMNPESNTVGYQYDENGNLRVKTDARGVSAHFSYDALNRVTRRWYNSSTSLTEQTNNSPALSNDVATSDEVAYFYDSQGLPSGAPPSLARGYATGRLVAAAYRSGSSAGDYYGYDGAGRDVLKIQQTGGSNYQVSATYNLAGAIISQTYPSGHIVNYGYDGAGRTNSMTGRLGDGRNRTYATGISYSSLGGISQEQFGTQTSLYHKLHYNLRGQLFDIRVSSYSLAADEWNWNRGALVSYYSSNFSWGGNSTGSGLDNNGNITRQQHWVPTSDPNNYSYTQDDYNYDSLDRLTSTNEIHGTPNSQSGQDYVQSYDYDRWGNRTINPGSSNVVNHAQFDKSDAQNTNRLYSPDDIYIPMNQRKMQYDPAGNLTHDSYTGDNRTRSYDAENRLSLLTLPPPPPVCYPDGEGGQTCYPVDDSGKNPPIQYVYDGDGHRVRRFIHNQETRQVYGMNGELLAEYAASTSPTTLQKEFGYRNGQLLITAAPGYGSSGSTGPSSSPATSWSSADLLARINKVDLPAWIGGLLSSRVSGEAFSDTSTPLYGPSFPYASLNTSVLPVMPQSGTARIAFASNRDGTAQLYSMNTDGSGALRLTNDAANDESPRWSPNGSRIVFQSDRDNVFSGMADIYVMNGDGSGQTRLTSDANDDSAPVWAPNGSKIAFQSARSGVSYQVFTMNSDGSGQANISNNAANDKQPSWSPDGTKIAFASDRDQAGFSSIYVMNADGSGQTRLTVSGSGFRDEQPAWSPDGTKLAFTSTRDSSIVTWTETDDNGNPVTKTAVVTNKEVYVMNANGSNQVRLTYTLENDDSPTWSSDGTQIAFRSDRPRDCCDPTNQVWVMNLNGTSAVDLSNNGFGDYSPNWSNIMTPPPPPNGAQFISQSVPQTMTAGQSYSVSVTMKDTGSNTWTTASQYNFGSQNAQDNTTWGMGRVALPSSVASGSQVTFNFTVTAPATSGTYNFQWRMVQDGVEWFGDLTPNVVVTVNPQSGGNPNPEPDPSTPIADVRWIVTDQLGTPRMIFDLSGSLAGVSRHDYLPFGEELGFNVGGRTTSQGYTNSDGARQKFTQKERDVETGLDYFGARYYSNVQGRFTSPDKPFADQNIVEPQSWNLYSYVRNNPLKYVDDFGDSITYASPDLEAISNAIRAQSPTYDEALKGFEGEGAPDLTIGYGDAGLDANGVDKATGVTKTSIRPEETLDDCSECPAKPMTHPVLPAKLKSANIVIDNSLKGDKSKTEDVLEHETGHGNHARKHPKDYSDNSAETTRTKGATPHDKRPNEIEANRFRDQVKAERKEYEKKKKEEEKQRKQEEKERKKHPDDFH
jgi:RHS repeat-associated protein